MSARDQLLDELDALLDTFALLPERATEGPRGAQYTDFALTRAENILRTAEDEGARRRFEIRLRLAMHLAPAAAIAYDRSSPTPRWRLVHAHLVDVFGRDATIAQPLAREIAKVLDSWERSRRDVSKYRAFLEHRDGPWCQHCRHIFTAVEVAADSYKPYYLSPEELTSPEVDHIQPVSGLGTNELDNLQLLCRLCNGGKDDGLGLPTRLEARYAATEIDLIPRAHRARMLYYVVDRDGRTCRRCASMAKELTIRRLLPAGGYLRSNLQTLCVDCAAEMGEQITLTA